MERKEIVREYEKELHLVSKGEMFGEHVMFDLIETVNKELPYLKEEVHKLLETSEVSLETKTLEEYVKFVENSNNTIVELYDFDTNDIQIEVIEEILLMVDKDEFLKVLDVRFNNEGDVL